jgi:hypothetical protein
LEDAMMNGDPVLSFAIAESVYELFGSEGAVQLSKQLACRSVGPELSGISNVIEQLEAAKSPPPEGKIVIDLLPHCGPAVEVTVYEAVKVTGIVGGPPRAGYVEEADDKTRDAPVTVHAELATCDIAIKASTAPAAVRNMRVKRDEERWTWPSNSGRFTHHQRPPICAPHALLQRSEPSKIAEYRNLHTDNPSSG